MDALCMKAGIHGMAAAGNVEFRLSAAAAEKPSVSAPPRNLAWGFTFRHPLRSLWPGSGVRIEPAIAVDDAVLADEKEGEAELGVSEAVHLRTFGKGEENDGELKEEIRANLGDNFCDENGECHVCDEDDDEKVEFDRESFSKLLRKVPLAESRLYAQLSYLGSLAYSIPQIKPGNLLRYHGLQFVTSSLEKKSKIEKENVVAENEQKDEVSETHETEKEEGNLITSTAAYQIAASAASYFHSRTKSMLSFNSSRSIPNAGNDQDVASLIATTGRATAVVAAEEDVKQAVADDLNSSLSSPCEWFICDDDQTATRFFVIQGSESLSSWKANLLFEPIQFEGMDVLVHRGIYEAAKGMYEQMLPEIQGHLKSHGNRAKFRFTGHSLGGSLSVLVNLMLLIRNGVPRSSLLPVITYGAPSIMCGGDRLLRNLGLPQNHVRSIIMHRDIVPRAFSCNYPTHVAEFLKAINGSFRSHPCLAKQKLLYAPMGEFLILQPDDKFSPNLELLPPSTGLYVLACPEKQLRAAQSVFLNSPHPLEILSDRSAYGSEGTVQRDHDMNSYLKCIRNVIRQDLIRIGKIRKDHRRKVWWPIVGPSGVNVGLIVRRSGQGKYNLSGMVRTGRESWRRFSTLVTSQHMHLLVVLLFPARLLVLIGNL